MNAVIEQAGLALREMRETDLATVMMVERAAYPHPWSEGVMRDCLRAGYDCRVGELDGRPVAHAVVSVAVGECHVLNITVHPDCQRRGFGRALLRALVERARAKGAQTAFLEVRASNTAARALYEAEGFCEIGRRRGYYPAANGREDALVLARELGSGVAGFQPPATSGLR